MPTPDRNDSTVCRVDVFSVKGGVGKTTVSYLLARAQASATNRPVLIVDADLTGTCIGDLLDDGTHPTWRQVRNLAHLVCGRPESLLERLEPKELPVYVHEPARVTNSKPARVSEFVDEHGDLTEHVIYCPSHADSVKPQPVDRNVLQALIGHESAGGWVRYVIQEVISAAEKATGGLGGVIVDHSPGVAALQYNALADIQSAQGDRREPNSARRALVLTTCARVDLKMCNAFYDQTVRKVGSAATWIVNRVPADWRARPGFDDDFGHFRWLDKDTAKEIPFDEELRTAYLGSRLSQRSESEGIARSIGALRDAIFEV